MEGDFIKVNKWLMPLSWLYGLGVRLRNMLFDMGVLKSHAFSVPVISVGNITVGGTGKTPHVEYLVELLQGMGNVAVLSRGYKRKTRGFVLADGDATARTIGDEPMQVKRKYPKAVVAVDSDRVRGIRQLQKQVPDIDVILLDDAFQHRYVKPGINILLVDYHRLVIYDRLLPAGRLREPLNGKNRADVVIITKCPKELKPMDFRVITKAMDLYPYQTLFFTTFDYAELKPVFPDKRNRSHHGHGNNRSQGNNVAPTLAKLSSWNVLLLTGIASPRQLKEDLAKLSSLNAQPSSPDQQPSVSVFQTQSLTFPDHHAFRQKDIRRINSTFEALPQPRCIITTEKDAARLVNAEGLSDDVRHSLYALPVRVSFMLDQGQTFCDNIVGYVQKNSRNSILAKRKEEEKTTSHNVIRFSKGTY